MEKEQWKDIEGFEGYYQVSDMGRVKSLSRIYADGRVWSEKIMKGSLAGDYAQVGFFKDGKSTLHRVHKLVAQAFIPNEEGKPFVYHVNFNKLDNRAENLRWGDRRDIMDKYYSSVSCDEKDESFKRKRIDEDIIEGEVWKDIKGYEGSYKVSNLGRFASLVNGQFIFIKGYNINGYNRITLKKKSIYAHNIVAETFIPKEERTSGSVIHINGINDDNRVSNLKYSNSKNLFKKKGFPVCQYDLKGNLIKVWNTAKEASVSTGVQACSISECVRNIRPTSGGFIWKKVGYELTHDDIERTYLTKHTKVCQYTKKLELIKTWDSIISAEKALGIDSGDISMCCKGNRGIYSAGGFIWKYYGDEITDEDRERSEYIHKRSGAVCQYDSNGELVGTYKNVNEVWKKFGYSKSCISERCRGNIKKPLYKGYIWKFEGDPITEKDLRGK